MTNLRASVLTGFALMFCAAGSLRAAPPFSETGVAFLEKNCVSCHGKEKQKAGLALDGFRDDLSLLRARRKWSEVIEKVQSGDMPPDDKPQPTDAERQQFLASVTAVFLRADNAPPDPGRVTVRRLNRAEYNNTIRDLLHVDFRPADDFPSDDVGHGFNNIGDVLSVSPVLMERYLDAAEQIAEHAIPIAQQQSAKHTMAGRYLEPALPLPKGNFRRINAAEKELIDSGPLHTPARLQPAGEYVLRTKIYAEPRSNEPVRVALLAVGAGVSDPAPLSEIAKLDGRAVGSVSRCRILKIAEVTARDEAHAQVIEAKIPLMPGVDRIAIAPLKPAHGEPPTLFVEFLEYEGPLDWHPEPMKGLLAFSPDKPKSEQVREALTRFVPRAWRRPVSEEEFGHIYRITDHALGHGEVVESALRRAVAAVLSSPKFIFRLEPDDSPENPAPHPVSEYQLATRLSYFLWSSCPDDELFHLASKKQLAANLDAQVRRMIKDPRSQALVDNFAMQWLQLGRLAGHTADEKTFPSWNPNLQRAMIEETRRFCGEIMRDDRSILDLLDADFTWVNRPLAELYHITPRDGFQGDEWKRVTLAGTHRGGLLTQASVLTVTSNPTRTSPVKRGKWVLEQLLGNPPPAPPPNVPSLDDAQRKELHGTLRQKLDQHRADPNCASCHAKMDTFGLALENFNGIGQWRDRDETGAPVDASGEIGHGRKLSGVDDLKALLKDRRKDFARCLTEKMLTYALGRGLDYYDERTIERVQSSLASHDCKFSSLVTQIVKSDPFLLRRGAGQNESTAQE